MDKKIPLYFDTVIINSPIQEIANNDNSNISRLKVGAFYKYKNRNGSYITDEYAQHLIESATRGNVPVVGFFDPGEQSWASHTGPTLANGYGYVENFLGWEPFTDTDGVTRDYAVFSVVLFTEYYEEARKVIGQNQSMELDADTIEGDWARFDDEEYFVYTKGNMSSFCIIGAHEPCFSVSSFFSKNDEINNQIEKFSSLLSDLKTVVEEAENNKGGEHAMEDFENQVVVEEVTVEENHAEDQFQEVAVEEESPVVEETPAEPTPDFEALQQQLNELQANYEALQSQYESAQATIAQLQSDATANAEQFEALRTQNEELQASISTYEAQITEIENSRKNDLINTYSELVDSAEIDEVRAHVSDFSYEALESKLAISFAKKQIADKKTDMVLIPEPETEFASIMKNYKK